MNPSPETPQETLSEAERQFDRWRKRAGLWAGPALAVIVFLLPLPLTPSAHRMAALMAGVVIYWVTEAIPMPITALLAPVLAILLGLGKTETVLAAFGDKVIFVFIGSFLIARAMEIHRLDRRFAGWILSFPSVGKTPGRILGTVGAITAFLSMWISNTAATAMIFPIALGILSALPKGQAGTYATGMMLMVGFGASVGGIGTPIGTPPNLIGIGLIAKQTGHTISFFTWMALAVPLMLVMFAALYLLLFRLHPPPVSTFQGEGAEGDGWRGLPRSGAWTAGERNALAAFLVAVFLWILPGLLGMLYGGKSEGVKLFNARLPEGGVAILAAALLFILPTDRANGRFTLSWEEAAQIDWGTILLFGGGLALGNLMFETGLSRAIGEGFTTHFQIQSLWGITGVAILLGIIVSELTSNTASANMIVPVAMAIAVAAGVSPLPPALGATLGASYGFMLPISTPPNAIVYGSGLIPIGRMTRAGVFFDIIGFFIIWGGLRLLCPLLRLI
jgi:sodium-dependent dicarboxylate transporter 2/3/5